MVDNGARPEKPTVHTSKSGVQSVSPIDILSSEAGRKAIATTTAALRIHSETVAINKAPHTVVPPTTSSDTATD